MKGRLFKSNSTTERPKPARQTIRGRISGPIPIAESTADEEFPIRNPGTAYVAPAEPSDDEFPVRQPGARIASTVPIEGTETEHHLDQPSHLPQASTTVVSGVSGSRADVGQATRAPEPPFNAPPAAPPSGGPSPSSAASGSGTSPTHRRTNPSSTLRYSQVSAASTGNTGQSGSGRPQRKKSTLRGALSRLFGRRKKTASQTSAEIDRAAGLATTTQHRSVSA